MSDNACRVFVQMVPRYYNCRTDHVGVCMKAAEILSRTNNACKQIVISRVVEESGGKFVLRGQVSLRIQMKRGGGRWEIS